MVGDLESFIYQLRKMEEERKDIKPKRNLSVNHTNLETFEFKIDGECKMDLMDMVSLYDYIKGRLSYVCDDINTLTSYHKDSPHYWGKVEKLERDGDEFIFDVSIDLEKFIEVEVTEEEFSNIFYSDEIYLENSGDNIDVSKIIKKPVKIEL